MGDLRRYGELRANVRYDGRYHPVRALVQPGHALVREVAAVLSQSPDPARAAHEFVSRFTSYKPEVGDFWAQPGEMLEARQGDCDDSAILLCSLLRNYLPPEKVFCAVGMWRVGGSAEGHMWVVIEGDDGEDRVLESTAQPHSPLRGEYDVMALFNDCYAFATPQALTEFDLKPLPLEAREAVAA